MSIDPYAWSNEDLLKTPFPAQTEALISLFKLLPLVNNQVPAAPRERSIAVSLPPTKRKAPVLPDPKKVKENSKDINPFSVLSNASDGAQENWVDFDSDVENASINENSHSDTDEKEFEEPVSDWEDLDDNALQYQFSPYSNSDEVSQNSSYKTVCQEVELAECIPPVVNPASEEKLTMLVHNEHKAAVCIGKIESEVNSIMDGVGLQPERHTILKKLKELFSMRQQGVSSQDCVESSPDQCVPEETLSCDPLDVTVEDKTSFQEHLGEFDELRQIIADLSKRAEALEKKQKGSDQDLLFLREVVKDSGRKVQQLEYLVDELQFRFDSSLSLPGSMHNTLAKPSIFLIGGYNGVTWLSSLDSFSPEKDTMVGLTPMSFARSYASAAALDGHIFAFGGGGGKSSWYNTVECYSSRNNEWIECPSLNRKKGSLAGISLNSKIYAIGGGDGNETFSEVEMFDPYLGKWLCGPSMLIPRFALAVAELNGTIYATGGYDGSMYLQSAERYDQREGVWVRLRSMNTKRGCHALTVLGESLYAMGGYNGDKMVSSVEIFDPRLNAWRMGDPMSAPRGYAAAVTLDGSAYLIGGLESNVQILATVEVYNASSGWSVLGLSSLGKRSFASAVVM
ncbi:DCD (Development and Cell Death) domain protein [Zea mays]|uniref:DCD (Development and Cell Death) domain protein n=1 Tax=Zea mays TaxID=4577 RepID=A0A1D6LYI2_MAIZE|nr:DCD (Development and Cell Death) domain protein [Zea mays]